MQPHFRGSLEELSALGFDAREVPHPDASTEHRAACQARNEALARMQGAGLPLRGERAVSAQARPRPRGAGRPARRAAASSTTAGSDPGDDGEPEPRAHVLRFARGAGLTPDQVRWCRRCGVVAFSIDAHQNIVLDRRGFTTLCPDCRVGAAV